MSAPAPDKKPPLDDKDSVVTLDVLKEFTDKNNQGLAVIFSDALNKTKEQTAQRLNEMAGNIDQIVAYIKQEQPQGQVPVNSLANKLGIPQEVIDNALSKVVDRVMGSEQRPAEEDTLLDLIMRGKRRKLVNELTKEVGTLIKRGYVEDEEVEDALGHKIESAANRAIGGDHKIA